jgi:hypothetical protein
MTASNLSVGIGETKEIELGPCHYDSSCRVKNCRAKATIIARGLDAIGRPTGQYELCALHAEQVEKRERAKGRKILR